MAAAPAPRAVEPRPGIAAGGGWRRGLVLGGLLVAGIAAAHGAAAHLADALAIEAAGGAALVGDAVEEASAPAPEPPSLAELVALGDPTTIEIPRGVVEHVPLPSVAPGVAGRAAPRRVSPAAAVDAPRGILVRAALVRAAVARGGRPSGTRVAAEGARPAGLVLHGVSAYGSALRDGDVLVRVGGTDATSEGRVIAAVSGAVRSGARAIDGEIWRGGRRIPVVVELPRFRKSVGERARKKPTR